ncbi:Mu transposase C-terminal domain-containing protein [Lysinibacillus fusiformis]|uniref:Mu transposase C-terminal domain-containing protein n=1 Tax=Lysinibacillus fusiformis TaxID=28031 RepID=UPI003D07DC01
MNLSDLKLNGEIEYYGLKYVILTIEPPNVKLKRNNTSGDAITINYFELITNPSFHAGKSIRRSIENDSREYFSVLESLDDKKREEVSKRLRIIRPLLLLEKIKQNHFPSLVEFHQNYEDLLNENENPEKLKQEVLIDRLAIKNSISKRTIKRYLSSYRKVSIENPLFGEEGLISEAGTGYKYRRDNKILIINHPNYPEIILDQIQIRLSDEYIPIIKEVIEKEYLTTQRKNKAHIIEVINIQCSIKGLAPVKPETMYKIFKRISSKVIERMRIGKKALNKYEEVNRGFANNEALYPLHLVEIDHTRMDIEVIDEKSGLVKGRPWITLGIDVYSRMVWCMHISFEPPSANKVRKAIQHGVLFKNTKEEFGTFNNWEIFGIPNIIQFDNGSEFNNLAIKRLVNETLMSNIRFRPIATPRYGGTIERLFGTINTKVLHNLHGTTKSNIFQKREYDSSENALLTLENIEEILTQYITDVYHFQKHEGLPLDCNSPMARFHEGLKMRGLPEFIEPEDEDAFKISILPTLFKPYTKDGVRIDNRLYRTKDLSNLIDKREIKYNVKYDIDDISYIYIKPPNEVDYVRVNIVSPPYESVQGMNAYTYKLLNQYLKETGELKRNKIATEGQIQKAKEVLYKNIAKMYKTNRRARQQAERMELDIKVIDKNDVKKDTSSKNLSYEQLLANAIKNSNFDEN